MAVYSLSIHQLLSGQPAELPAWLYTGIADTSSIPIEWESGGWLGSHKVVGKDYVNTQHNQMPSISAIFISKYHTKQLNPWQNSSDSCVVNYSWLSAC